MAVESGQALTNVQGAVVLGGMCIAFAAGWWRAGRAHFSQKWGRWPRLGIEFIAACLAFVLTFLLAGIAFALGSVWWLFVPLGGWLAYELWRLRTPSPKALQKGKSAVQARPGGGPQQLGPQASLIADARSSEIESGVREVAGAAESGADWWIDKIKKQPNSWSVPSKMASSLRRVPPLRSTADPSRSAVDRAAAATLPPSPVFTSRAVDVPALPTLFRFDYADRDGVLTRRTVMVQTVGQSNGRTYLEGICQVRHAVRTFRTDRIIGTLEHVGSGETLSVAALVRAAGPLKKLDVEPPAREYHPGAHGRPRQDAVLFTGFRAGRRAELEELAIAAGWDVRVTVGPTLDYLVAGPNAGPAKIGKAEGDGVTVISEEMFRTMVS